MIFKKGDFVIYKDQTYHKYCLIINTYRTGHQCLTIEALNDESKQYINIASSCAESNLKLVTDEKEIARLRKIMVFM